MRTHRILRLLIWTAFVFYKSLAAADDEVIVPPIPAGKTVPEAKMTLRAAGLAAGFNAKGGRPDSKDLEFKTTGAQDPPGGSKAKRDAPVTVSIYQKYEPKTSPTPSPAAPSSMPDLTGKTLEQAVALAPGEDAGSRRRVGRVSADARESDDHFFSNASGGGRSLRTIRRS